MSTKKERLFAEIVRLIAEEEKILNAKVALRKTKMTKPEIRLLYKEVFQKSLPLRDATANKLDSMLEKRRVQIEREISARTKEFASL